MDRAGNKRLSGTGTVLNLPYFLGLKAGALHLADRTSEALEAINEAEALVERSEDCCWCAEMHRLRGVFLAAMGANEMQIEASFCEAIRTAKERSRFRWRNAQKRATRNTAAKSWSVRGHVFRLPLSIAGKS